MNLFRILAASSGGISDLENPALWLTEWAAGGVASTAGETVSPDTAISLSAYYACLHVISEDIGKLPLKVYRRLEKGGKEVDTEHPIYKLIHTSPNEAMSSMTFREVLTHWAMGWGGGFAQIVRGMGGEIKALLPIHPNTINPEVSEDFKVRYKVKRKVGEKYLPSEEVFHLHGLGGDGVSGYSILRIACESLGLSLAEQRFGAAFFGNGSSLSGVLETPQTIKDPKVIEGLRKQWRELYSGAKNAGTTAILEAGMKYNKIGIPPEEAQFLESRQFQVEEICRWFRVPPHKIQHLLRSTFSNIEQQSIEYVTDTLLPWAVRWEQEIQRKLIDQEDDEHFAEHVFAGLLRGDQAARGQYYRTMLEVGGLSPDEIRELENLNPVPGGDQRFRPTNLTPLDEEDIQGDTGGNDPPPVGQPIPPGPEVPEEDQEDDEGEAPPAEEEPAPEKPSDKTRIREALHPVFLYAASRVARRETTNGLRALEANRGNRPRLEAWAKKFFDQDHLAYINESMRPAVRALHGLGCGAGRLPTSETFQRHMAETVNDLVAAFDAGAGDMFEEQESTRAAALAESTMKEIIG